MSMPSSSQSIALLQRGRLVHSYGSIEFSIGETLWALSGIPEYELERPSFNHSTRLAQFRKAMDLPGPLQSHLLALRESFLKFDRFEEYRHALVHGLMMIADRDGQVWLRLKRHTFKDGPTNFTEIDLTLDQLTSWADDMEIVSGTIVGGLDRMFKALEIPALKRDNPTRFVPKPSSVFAT